jgi:divalent metal cation (Fe/Co/Zn/Cd) transporter
VGSSVLAADARSSLNSILLALVLLAGSLVCFFLEQLWYVDAAVSIVLGLLLMREGFATFRVSCRREFAGVQPSSPEV